MDITADQLAYIKLYGARLRKANKQATEAANKWEDRKAHLTARAVATGWDLEGKTYRDFCTNDWQLIDAMNMWSWFEREAKRCKAAIDGMMLEIQARQSHVYVEQADIPRARVAS